jgi:hypothetical protein
MTRISCCLLYFFYTTHSPCNCTIFTKKQNQLVAQCFLFVADLQHVSARFIGYLQGAICSDVSTGDPTTNKRKGTSWFCLFVNYFRTRYSDITRQEPELRIPVHLNSTYDLDHPSSCFGFIINLQLAHQTGQQDLLHYQDTKCDNCVCISWGESTYCFT